jgi:hypothetical protein
VEALPLKLPPVNSINIKPLDKGFSRVLLYSYLVTPCCPSCYSRNELQPNNDADGASICLLGVEIVEPAVHSARQIHIYKINLQSANEGVVGKTVLNPPMPPTIT